jgi:hypothetical protein
MNVALLHGGTFLLINWQKEAAKAVANLQGIGEEHAEVVGDSCKSADLEVSCLVQGNGGLLHRIDEEHGHECMSNVGDAAADKTFSDN